VIRDRDCIYGAVVTRRLRAMGIRDKPIALASPWQNGFVERLIGSIRRECVDHIIVLGEAHLRRILKSYARYYNETRTHLALDKDTPVSRPVQRTGVVRSLAILGGLHHHYARAYIKFSVLKGISSNALSARSSTFAGLPRDTTKTIASYASFVAVAALMMWMR
jgi:Integrase core domain